MIILVHYVLIHRNFIQLQTQCVTHPDYPIIQLFVFESYRNDIEIEAARGRNRTCEAARSTKTSSRKHSGQAGRAVEKHGKRRSKRKRTWPQLLRKARK